MLLLLLFDLPFAHLPVCQPGSFEVFPMFLLSDFFALRVAGLAQEAFTPRYALLRYLLQQPFSCV